MAIALTAGSWWLALPQTSSQQRIAAFAKLPD